MPYPLIDEFERMIRRDPAQRGLIACEDRYGPLLPGHLAQAAEHLAATGRRRMLQIG